MTEWKVIRLEGSAHGEVVLAILREYKRLGYTSRIQTSSDGEGGIVIEIVAWKEEDNG